VDGKCAEQPYGTVPVGARMTQPSFVGHIFRLRDPLSGAIVKEATVTAGSSTVTLP
jgi:hypothetical protein